MTVRFYSSIAQETTLVSSITNVSTTITVAAVTGFPSSTPYTLAIDYNTASEELVTVTGTSGTLLTVTRASDGTSAISHSAGAKVRHTSSARDFADSRSHENATTDIHGVPPGASIVSTTGVQVLSNKTLVAPTAINGATFDNINVGAWVTYAPTWGCLSNPQPALGIGGTLTGRYLKVGRMVHAKIFLQPGTSPTLGTSGYTFTVPFAAQTASVTGAFLNVVATGSGIVDGFGPAPMTTFITAATPTKVSASGIMGGSSPAQISYFDHNGLGVGISGATLDIVYEATS